MAEEQEPAPTVWDFLGDPPSQPRCEALIGLEEYLRLHSLGPPAGNDGAVQRMVATCLGVENKAITWSSMAVVNNGSAPRFVVPANVLFPTAPDIQKIVLKRDYTAFKMIPGTNYSQWLGASFLGMKFYHSWLGSTRDSEEAWDEDVRRYGYGEFLLRLFIIPMADYRLAELIIVAMPVTQDGFARLADSHVAGNSGNYPCILFDVATANPATVGPRPGEGGDPFGMPCLPICILPREAELPEPGVVINAGRMLWDSCVQPYIVSAEEWTNLTAEAPVPTEDRAVDHPWPRVAPEVVPQGDGGRFVECV